METEVSSQHRSKLQQPSPQEVQTILTIVKALTGSDLSSCQPEYVSNAIERRMLANEINQGEVYTFFLIHNPSEAQFLNREFKASGGFFRNQEALEALRFKIVPKLFANHDETKKIRIWNIGCGTGEEAYSVGIAISEYLENRNMKANVQIFASDNEKTSLTQARAGIFEHDAVASLGNERLQKYFTPLTGSWQIKEGLRKMIVFALHRILQDPPFAKLDLIICRNSLLYLNTETQKWIFSLFHTVLNPEGLLFLGTSEIPEADNPLFEPIDRQLQIFRKRPVNAQPRVHSFTRFSPLWTIWANSQSILSGGTEKEKKQNPLKMAEKHLVEHYAPPCIVVNSHFEVHQFMSDIGKYFRLPEGEPTMDIFKMARREIQAPLRTSIEKALTEHKEVVVRDVKVGTKERREKINIIVSPLGNAAPYDQLALVIMEPATWHKRDPLSVRSQPSDGASPRENPHVRQLEDQLIATQEQLQAAVEQQESSVEEYLTANEELMAMNEELQVTNEELQSSNTELNFSREELERLNKQVESTNAQLRDKVEELNRMHNDMKLLFACSGIATIFLDQRLTVKRFSPAMTELLDIGPDNLDTPLGQLSLDSPWQMLPDEAQKVLETLTARRREITLDQNSYIMQAFPYIADNKQIDGVVITLVEVTDLKQAQAALEAGNLELASINRELESFIYSISHDLRGPLRSMVGFSDILARNYGNRLDDNGREYLDRIIKGGYTMGKLIEDLLRLSRMSRQEMNREKSNLSEIAQQIITELRESQPEREVELEIEKNMTAHVDPPLFEAMLSNLLQNAWKFTAKKDKPKITFNSYKQDGYTVYQIKDNGAGFDTTYAEKMFWPFHRLHSSNEFPGTGIGLAIVERIIHRHGGLIWADGKEKMGATFYFTLEGRSKIINPNLLKTPPR